MKKREEGGFLWEKDVAQKLAARKLEEASDDVVERVQKARGEEKTQCESSTPSCTRFEVLQQSKWDLERNRTAMLQEITILKQESTTIKQAITKLKNELEPFKATSLKYHKVLRKFCLSEAQRKVTDLLKKAPAPEETWESFMLGLTQEEVGTLDLSPDSVNVLGTRAYSLTKAAHEAALEVPTFQVAIAIIDAPTRKEMWEELFQFCYGVPTWDVLESFKQSDL